MSVQSTTGGGVRATPGGGTLGDVLDRVLDKGIVIEAWAAVSLLGIEIVSIQAQVVVASVETYLKYARAVSSALPEAQEATPSLPWENELVKYLGEHTGGIQVQQLAEHFHVPRAQVEAAVSHLVDEHRVRKDEARDLLLPANA